MSRLRPVLFFAFANDRSAAGSYLRNLPEEARQLRQALALADQQGQCEVVVLQNVTLDDILRTFHDPRYHGRIALFHYGGHAESFGLLLETAQGEVATAHAEGLAHFLGRQRSLQLLFLNGCSTAAQSKLLLEAGVPLVIATAQAIDDTIATNFATRFYEALAAGKSADDAFASARAAIQAGVGTEPRGFKMLWHTPPPPHDAAEPWSLTSQPGGESARAWQLATAANDPYFGLPPLPQDIDLPVPPFLGLHRFERRHARIFFGRGWTVRELLLHLTNPKSDPVLLFYGQTGVGKSSLLDAGVLPRLQQEHTVLYKRRIPSEGLLGGLCDALGLPLAESAQVRERWREREASSGRPLTLLLDQVEEAFTQPYSGEQPPPPADVSPAMAELAALMSMLHSVFSDPATRPQGKMILSFRKEHLAEIMDAIEAAQIPHTAYFLKPLDRSGAQEAVVGVAGGGHSQESQLLRAKYKLTIEDEDLLATQIADDLLADKESPIAVTLQILLTEMWEAAVAADRSHPRFTAALYEERHKAGLLLSNFLDRQQAQMAEGFPEPSESGLVLDLLYQHTTELGTAQEHTKAELSELYPHRAAILPALLQGLTDSYLLVDASGDKAARAGILRLAHDTLAPLVRQRFERSPLPGQRATRLLLGRVGTPTNPRPTPSPLDDGDLKLVEAGKEGMRKWHKAEEELVQRSQVASAQRARNRRNLQWAGIALVATIIVLGIVATIFGVRAGTEANNARQAESIAQAESTRANQEAENALNAQETAEAEAEKARQAESTAQAESTRANEEAENARIAKDEAIANETIAIANQAQAEREARRARAGEIAANAQAEMDSYQSANDTALLLARDAVLTTWLDDGYVLPRADAALSRAISMAHWRMTLPHASVNSVAYSPDGSHIVSGGGDGTLRIWDAKSGEQLNLLEGHTSSVNSVAYSTDGTRIVSGGGDNTIRIWDAESGQQLHLLEGHTDSVNSVAYSPDGTRILSGSEDHTIRIWDAESGEQVNLLDGHTDLVSSVAFSPDGTRIVSSSYDTTIRIWDAESGEQLNLLEDHKSWVNSVAYSPDGARIVSSSEDHTVRIWDALTGNRINNLEGYEFWINSVVYSPDGSRIVAGGFDQKIRIWDTETGEQLNLLEGHTDSINSVAFSPNGTQIVSGGIDNKIQIWNITTDEQLNMLEGHVAHVTSVAFSPDSSRVASGSHDKTIRIWDRRSGALYNLLDGHTEAVNSIAYSPDGSHIVSGSDDNTIRIWDVQSGEQLNILEGHLDSITSVAYSPNGTRIVSSSEDHTIRIWDAESGEQIMLLEGHTDAVTSVAYNPGGTRIVSGSYDNTTRIWDDESGEQINLFRDQRGSVTTLAYSPDGTRIVSDGSHNTVEVWNVENGEQIMLLEGHLAPVTSIAYSSDGTRIISGSYDNTIRIWDAGNGLQLNLLEDHLGSANSVAYSPDGRRIVSGGNRGMLRIWTACVEDRLQLVEARIQQPEHMLNEDERIQYGLEAAPVYTSSWRETAAEFGRLCPTIEVQ